MKILVLDIGGTNVKIYATGHLEPLKIPSGPRMTAKKMVEEVKEATAGWDYSVVSIGYPGPVVRGKPFQEPANLGPGWIGFDFKQAFGCPVKIVNDAAMQALGSYRGGRLLFLGLGTGLGSALIMDGVLEPMELAHLPYKTGKTFEDYVGAAALKRKGEKKWKKSVMEVVAQLKAALQADHVVLGGGNSKLLTVVPRSVYLGNNSNAREGGFRLWQSEPVRKALAAAGD
jgi:predicted NBD/HSP70 family sugar kinase